MSEVERLAQVIYEASNEYLQDGEAVAWEDQHGSAAREVKRQAEAVIGTRGDLTALFAEVLANHRDMQMLTEGMWADGEIALLRCTCGWRMNVPIDDNMLPAVPIWEQHQAEQLAKVVA